jgi:colanic acid/amylovoran biosynthesis glycosyltransferase
MRVCVVRPGEVALTETFIRAHAERLPGEVSMICGSPPRLADDPGSVPGIPRQLFWRAHHLLCGRPEHERHTRAFIRLLSRVRPDAVLAEYGPNAVRVLSAVQALRIPLVAHFHGYDASKREVLDRFQEGYREVFRYASAVVGVSRPMCETLVRMGASPARVHHIPCGVDVEEFVPGDPAQAPPRFLAAGRLVEKKAPHLLLLAFARARRAVPEARLRILGNGPLEGVCQDLISGLGLADAVELAGAQPHRVVRREMARSRAFVQHSVVASSGDTEGTPVVVMEAGAAGLPVIGTRHAGIPDVVKEERTGLLVEERDVEAMGRAMVRLAKDPGLARSLGSAARRRVLEGFSMERSIHRLGGVIRDAVEESRVSTPVPAPSWWLVGRGSGSGPASPTPQGDGSARWNEDESPVGSATRPGAEHQ